MKRTMLLLSISVFAVVILVSVQIAEAQAPAKMPRLGYLTSRSKASPFWERLRKLGYVEGQNIVIIRRLSYGKGEQYPKLAAELVDLKVDVIFVNRLKAALAAKKATSTIPIVVVTGVDLVRTGLVDSLARPGGNVTGITRLQPELEGKRLHLLKEAFPSVSRVGVLRDPDAGTATGRKIRSRQIKTAAEALGMELHFMDVGKTKPDIEAAFEAAMKRHVDAFIVLPGQAILNQRSRIVELIAKTRLPAMYNSRIWVRRGGGLMYYGAHNADLYRLAARYVDRILKGAKPSDLPVQRATRFYLYVNLKTAKKQGLTFSPQFLARADKVIK